MTTTQVAGLIHSDSVSKRNGVFTVRKGFFYRHGYTSDMLVDAIKALIPTAVIVDHGEVWKAFKGGAATAQSSHWFVKFTVPA